MHYSDKALPYMTAAAIAMIVVTNYCILHILADGGVTFVFFARIWPILMTSTVAIILVMSTLHRALQGVLRELERREAEARQSGLLDPLTGLGNRLLLEERMKQAIGALRRKRRCFAVLLLDLDKFKYVNDALGHPIGDELLKQAAARLGSVVRETDTLARFGGDEFIVLQTDIRSPSDVKKLAGRFIQALAAPFKIDGNDLTIGVSIGAAVANKFEFDPSEYIRRADIALYRAKADGRNRFEFYSTSLDELVKRRSIIERDLREAVEFERDLEVYFQPQVDSRGQLVGAEALLRWDHPEFGKIPAQEIIRIAEESGVIRVLGKWVFRQACKMGRNRPELSIAVNFSPTQLLSSKALPAILAKICEDENVPCSQLELELTESLFLEYDSGYDAVIEELRRAGFRIALDDFGAGYSSLSYLRRFEVDRVKLDKCFSQSAEARESIAIIRAAVMLAHALDLEVIAEGIETEQQEQVALQGGCDGLQGFRYGAPMPAHDFVVWVDKEERWVA